jgi:hypothetical protein
MAAVRRKEVKGPTGEIEVALSEPEGKTNLPTVPQEGPGPPRVRKL